MGMKHSNRVSPHNYSDADDEALRNANVTLPTIDSSVVERRTEELAQAILGVNILRSLFLDLLGRPRNSAAATAYRHRCDELAPNKYREYPKKWASFVLWGLALLSFMCCVTSFCALDVQRRIRLTLYLWYVVCRLCFIYWSRYHLDTDQWRFNCQCDLSPIPTVGDGSHTAVVRAALRLWRRICEQNENNMLMGAAGSRDMGKLGNSRQLLHSLVEGAHLSKYYDTKNSAILGSRTKALLGHLFSSFRLAKAHPFCLKLHWSNVLTRLGCEYTLLFSLGCGG